MGIIRCYKFSDHFDFEKLRSNAINMFRTKLLKDALILEKDDKYGFIFKYGVAVFWDFEDEEFVLKKLSSTSVALKRSEDFRFENIDTAPIKVEADTIYLDNSDELTQLAVSFAIAQSIKLSEFEDAMVETLAQTEHIPLELANNGRVLMPRREIAKERGRLFLTKSKIYLHFELLDIPEFFWEYPELETYYLAMRKYLDLQSRIDILHRKMNVIQEILEILADEQNHKHSSLLEWIIIILIAFEIVIFIGNELQ